MVKKRTPAASPDLEKRITEFADAADGHKAAIPAPGPTTAKRVDLDKNAPRGHKAIRVPFNEYEYTVLVELAEKLNRPLLNTLRHAMLQLAEKEGITIKRS